MAITSLWYREENSSILLLGSGAIRARLVCGRPRKGIGSPKKITTTACVFSFMETNVDFDLAEPCTVQPTPLLPTTRWHELALRDELRQDVGVAELVDALGLGPSGG